MNTNIDDNGLADARLLEDLVNQLFKESESGGIPGVGPIQQSPVQKPDELINNPAIRKDIPFAEDPFVNPFAATPPFATGIGISPGSAQHYDTFLPEKNSILPEQKSKYSNGITTPVSVAGSGASPSAVKHGNNINFKDPQTSFPDENLKNNTTSGERDASSPANMPTQFFLPVDADSSYLHDLQDALSIKLINPLPQLSQHSDQEKKSYYYFLPSGSHFSEDALTQQASQNKYSSSSLYPWQFDPNNTKKDFPILNKNINGKPIIWLDNAATTQKPQQVIDRVSFFYENENSNIHRAAHELAARATDAYEEARKKIQTFIGANSANEIVFVRGTTEAINLVAKSWGEQNLHSGDEIIVTHLEHHANIVPWQQLAAKKGLKLRVIPVDDDGQVLLDEYAKLLNSRTKLVSFTQVSNALGTITPAKAIIDMAHNTGAKVLLDGAQSVSHLRVNVSALNPDWFVFSGHKIFGPTGIGVLYGKEELLNKTEPWQGGGNMIKDVTFEHTEYQNAPSRFEAGTGNIADAVGLGAAIDYVNKLGIENIFQYEHYLLVYATSLLKQVPGLKLIGTAKEKTSVLSFVLDGYTNEQVGQALNKEGIAVRTGHHCAQPILRRFGLESTVRPSLAFYNTCADIDTLIATLLKLKRK